MTTGNIAWLCAEMGQKAQSYTLGSGGIREQDFADRCGAFAAIKSNAAKVLANTIIYPMVDSYRLQLEQLMSDCLIKMLVSDGIKINDELTKNDTILKIVRMVHWIHSHDKADKYFTREGKLYFFGVTMPLNTYRQKLKDYEEKLILLLQKWEAEIDQTVYEYRQAMRNSG